MDTTTETHPPPAKASPSGFVDALRILGDGLLATVRDRVGLVSVELREEKAHWIRVFVMAGAALFTGLLAIVFASLALVYLLRERAPLAALAGLAAFYAIVCVTLILTLRRLLRDQPPPFAATLEELDKDRSCLRRDS